MSANDLMSSLTGSKGPQKESCVVYRPPLFNSDAKFVPNSIQKGHSLRQCRKLVHMRCLKSAGTKMHKCLVGILLSRYGIVSED